MKALDLLDHEQACREFGHEQRRFPLAIPFEHEERSLFDPEIPRTTRDETRTRGGIEMIDGEMVRAIGVDGFQTPAHEAIPLLACVLTPCSCPGCPSAAILAAQEGRVVVCAECGASYEPEAVPEPSSAAQQVPIPGNRQNGTPRALRAPGKRTRAHTLPTDPDKRIRAIVTDLLAWHLAKAQRDAVGGGSFAPIRQSSPTASACRVLETGVIGDGNSGTKGTWRGIAPEPGEVHALAVDRQVGVRYWALGELRNIADAVIADANGDRVVDVELYAGKTLALSLAQRIGLALASVNQAAKWRVKIARRDSTPALEGMERDGREALGKLVDRWQELIEQERAEGLRQEARAEVMRGVRMEVVA
jgi:hypothetical protein